MYARAIDNAAFLTSAACLFAATVTAMLVWRVASILLIGGMGGKRFPAQVAALMLAGLSSIVSFHMVLNSIERGTPIFSVDSLAGAFAQTRDTIDGVLHPQHTALVPAGGDGTPPPEPSLRPRVIYESPRRHRKLPDAVSTHETWID